MATASQHCLSDFKNVTVPRHGQAAVVGLLTLGDILAVAAAGLVPYWVRLLLGPLDRHLYVQFPPALVLFPLSYLYAGLYPGYGHNPVDQLRQTFRMTTLVSLLLVTWWLLTVTLVPLVRALMRSVLARTSWWGQPVIVLGAAKTGEAVIRRLRHNPGLGLRPVAWMMMWRSTAGPSRGFPS